jgi:colicin import membrane protein
MIRKHENSDSWKAGIYAIAVHLALLVAMLISFNWKAAHPVLNVTEVELWDKLPAPKVVEEPKSQPKPEIKEEPEPKPVVVEKPKVEEPKVDIELEKKKKELDEQRKKEQTKQLAQVLREEDLHDKKAAEKKKNDDAMRKIKDDILNDKNADDAKAASAANASLIGEYTEKIKAKIRGNVNKILCGDGNPELRFEINLLPTGELSGNPKITKSSGSSACDEAVERAIIASSTASSPLPLPPDPSLRSQFKNLNLKFRPND